MKSPNFPRHCFSQTLSLEGRQASRCQRDFCFVIPRKKKKLLRRLVSVVVCFIYADLITSSFFCSLVRHCAGRGNSSKAKFFFVYACLVSSPEAILSTLNVMENAMKTTKHHQQYHPPWSCIHQTFSSLAACTCCSLETPHGFMFTTAVSRALQIWIIAAVHVEGQNTAMVRWGWRQKKNLLLCWKLESWKNFSMFFFCVVQLFFQVRIN